MKIFYDGQIFTMQREGGINRYFRNLIGRLPGDMSPVLTANVLDGLPEHPNLRVHACRRFAFRPGRLAYKLEGLYFRGVESFEHADVTHPTFYRLLTQRPIRRGRSPLVLTVWDFLHERHAKQMNREGTWDRVIRNAISQADYVFCISEHTRTELLERLPEFENRSCVTPLAPSLNPAEGRCNGSPHRGRYFLFVGRRDGYKNFDGALRGLGELAESGEREIDLVCAGPARTSDEAESIERFGLSDRIRFVEYPGDADLVDLYRYSEALIYPSLDEGFGLPPLEAMQCGAPVIAMRCTSLPEVVGDAGILVEPGVEGAIVDAMRRVLAPTGLADELRVKGAERVTQFSWDRTAAVVAERYRSLVGGSSR